MKIPLFEKLYEFFNPTITSVGYQAHPHTDEYKVVVYYESRKPRETVFRPANEETKKAARLYFEKMNRKARKQIIKRELALGR